MKRAAFTLLALFSLTYAVADNYDESVNGDLSGDRTMPTSISLSAGSNTVRATSVTGDREYWTVNVPAGNQLSALNVVNWVSIDNLGFIAVQNGTTFTEPPTMTNVANLLGYSHFGPGNSTVGTDILDDIGMGAGSMMFTPPLPAGNYCFWSQQTSGNPATYTLDLVVTSVVPVPALSTVSTVLACLGIALILLAGHRRLLS